MAQRKRKQHRQEEELEPEDSLWDNDEQSEEDVQHSKRDRFLVTVKFVVKTSDPDTAEDVVSDLLTEAVADLSEGYASEGEICDYYTEEVELAEL